MALRTAGSVLVVCLWSVTVELGQFGWGVTYTKKSICVLKGSTVDLACTYKYPWYNTVKATFWFTKNDAEGNPVSLRDDPDYKGRVEYSVDKRKSHTLTITDLRESDSAEYWFTFTTDQTRGRYTDIPGVTLSVTGKQTSVMTEAVGITVVLVVIICLIGFLWFRRATGGSDDTAVTQSVHPDHNIDTYTGLNIKTMSPDYDTLASVHPDPNSETYTPLNMKTRSPEYDTLANGRGSPSDTAPQIGLPSGAAV